jgi:hypothetical protein
MATAASSTIRTSNCSGMEREIALVIPLEATTGVVDVSIIGTR